MRLSCDLAPLDDEAEIWGTMFSLPAARVGATLRLPGPVDPSWRAGVQANVAQAAGWWGGEAVLDLDAATRPGGEGLPSRRSPGRALCFTGGVDSFFSLLCGDHRPTHLLFVAGFDLAVSDAGRAASVLAAVEDVAAAVGAEPLVVVSDLRTHPVFSALSWEQTHGAAIAGVGHALHRTIGTLVVAPSYARSRLVPWGSRPDLDVRWSVPGRLDVVHGDASGRRLDRVLAIAAHPLVQRHLRVCWQNVEGDLNCGRCEKCVRTMVMLAGADQLQHCATFPDRSELPGRMAVLPAVAPGHGVMWSDLVDLDLRPDEHTALRALLARSS